MRFSFLAFFNNWRRLRSKLFTELCRNDFYSLGWRTTLELPTRIQGARHIEIGSHVFVGAHSWLEVLEPEKRRSSAAIRIGHGTSISGFCTITATESVIVEAHALIARYVYISDHSHAHDDPLRPIKRQGISKIAPVRICEGAWLGQSVVICPGVTIGRNAVVGANSVVRSDVPDFCVAAGAPARVLRCHAHALSS